MSWRRGRSIPSGVAHVISVRPSARSGSLSGRPADYGPGSCRVRRHHALEHAGHRGSRSWCHRPTHRIADLCRSAPRDARRGQCRRAALRAVCLAGRAGAPRLSRRRGCRCGRGGARGVAARTRRHVQGRPRHAPVERGRRRGASRRGRRRTPRRASRARGTRRRWRQPCRRLHATRHPWRLPADAARPHARDVRPVGRHHAVQPGGRRAIPPGSATGARVECGTSRGRRDSRRRRRAVTTQR